MIVQSMYDWIDVREWKGSEEKSKRNQVRSTVSGMDKFKRLVASLFFRYDTIRTIHVRRRKMAGVIPPFLPYGLTDILPTLSIASIPYSD